MRNQIFTLAAIIGVLLSQWTVIAVADSGQYQTRAEFLHDALGVRQPPSDVVWLDDELQTLATDILGHTADRLRIRFWYKDARTAWVIDEIGKEKPITFGAVIENGKIHSLHVLHFRETRGWEIRYPFFTSQFADLRLTNDDKLNQRIDGITGATLSVRAATRSATLALALDEYVRRTSKTGATPP